MMWDVDCSMWCDGKGYRDSVKLFLPCLVGYLLVIPSLHSLPFILNTFWTSSVVFWAWMQANSCCCWHSVFLLQALVVASYVLLLLGSHLFSVHYSTWPWLLQLYIPAAYQGQHYVNSFLFYQTRSKLAVMHVLSWVSIDIVTINNVIFQSMARSGKHEPW